VGLVPAPRHRVIAVGHFTSSQGAIEATEDALACGPAAVELLDRAILELSRTKLEYQALGSIVTGDPDALLFVTFFGDTPAQAEAGMDRLEALWRQHRHGYHTLRAVTAAEQAAVLKVRQSSLGLLMAASSGSRRPLAFVEDTAVEPARLAAYTQRFREIIGAHGLSAGFYGHASVGCLHVRPFVDLTEPGALETVRAVAEEVRDLVIEFGGVNSSEHGDGLVRSEFNRAVFGDALYEAMREVKRLFDPANRMNPGKIVDAPPMTSNVREVAPSPLPYPSRLQFPGGMLGAADRCMNIGLCRKTATGVMCPSYMATREEEDSTRGRANALVKALSADEPRAALGDERLHQILDLCLECKACKSECPLGVDMASLKTEALAAYHDVHGIPLRSRMFGSIRALNRAGSAVAPLANLLGGFGPARLLAERVLGISARRPLPRFQRETLARWYTRRPGAGVLSGGAPQGELIFLADSFTSYTEPAVARAAVELLELAGWTVRLETAACCGRASLSKGLIDQARARATVALLRAIPGAEVTEVDAGCCGMAGSFGFEAEHYDLSMRIGELRLFPAVRAEPAGTIVAASGVSCRQQIAHGTGRAAQHPLEIVRGVAR